MLLHSLPLLLLSLASSTCAHFLSSIPEDLYAFPKYRVSFLHHLPLDNHTAERWLCDGLRGGLSEFLEEHHWHPNPLQAIESGDPHEEQQHPFWSDHQSRDHTPPSESSPVLEHMRLGPSNSYLCLIPPAPTLPPPPSDEAHSIVTPTHSWSLLQPLSGVCLYHRQAWFTYSYCHNLHVRQFRELPVTYPHPPGARVVEEDPEWESYTLGKAPSTPASDSNLAANDEIALANNLELARQAAGHRYLVQRWSDGTVCDKTGRPREIEIQFHCSMTMTDTILFVKETRTCEYVLVIHTPRLCGEPGFKSRQEQLPETFISCREVVDDVESVDRTLPEAQKRKARRRIPAPERPPEAEDGVADGDSPKEATGVAQDTAKLLREAVESLVGRGASDDMAILEVHRGDEGEFYVTLDAEVLRNGRMATTDGEESPPEQGQQQQPREQEREQPVTRVPGRSLEEALRAAGYEIKAQKKKSKESADEEAHDRNLKNHDHDEL